MRFVACAGSLDSPLALASTMLEPPLRDLPTLDPANIVPVPGGEMGWVYRANEDAAIPRVYRSDSGATLLVVGTPIVPGGDVQQKLQQAAQEGPAIVTRLARELDGAFALVYSSPADNTLTICTDFLGLQPLYWHQGDGILLVATSAIALARSGKFQATFNPAAWGTLLHYGTTFLNTAYCHEIQRVPAAVTATWHAAEGRLSTEEAPWWPSVDPNLTLECFDTGPVIDAFRAEVEAYRGWYPNPTLLLSGGGDSRLVLALLSEKGCEEALTVRFVDALWSSNVRFARYLGKHFVSRHHWVEADRNFFSSREYWDFLRLHEMSAPAVGLFIPNLFPAVRRHGASAYWDGLMPGIHAFPVVTGDNEDLHAFISRVTQKSETAHVQMAALVFRRPQDIFDGYQSELQRVKQHYANDREEIGRFFVQNRTRNRVSKMPLQVTNAYGAALIPGVSKAVFASILALPVKHRQYHSLYHVIFERHFRKLLACPIISRGEFRTSAHTSAGWRVFASAASAYKNSFVRRGLNRVLPAATQFFHPSKLVDRVVATIDPEHPDLNPDVVRNLQNVQKERWVDTYAKQYLFYWKTWRDMMDCKASTSDAGLFD
jgi:hypothetical protein